MSWFQKSRHLISCVIDLAVLIITHLFVCLYLFAFVCDDVSSAVLIKKNNVCQMNHNFASRDLNVLSDTLLAY